MFARSTTFNGLPGNIEAGIRFVSREAGPMLDQIDGCRGLSLLVDRETGQCIATSSWASQAQMIASDSTLRPLRERGRDILGGSMQADEWEIAILHRTHHGSASHVAWFEGDLDAIAETTRVAILPSLEQSRSFCSASLLTSPQTGLACLTTTWDNHGAREAARSTLDLHYARLATEAHGQVVDTRDYELAYAHLNVPEMT